ncbi:MAG TPA: Holliday junction resolvase RuvX [Actinomycetota bacterium]|nr:Holliday junction resolvase RuvX [Actinomycetota bacterium]
MTVQAPAGAVLGIDPGERRIGIALAVAGTAMALPLTVLDRAEGWLDVLADLAAAHAVAAVVIGLPVSLRGTEGAAAEDARAMASEVGERLGIPVHLVDERLSTVAADRALAATGAAGRRRRQSVDRSAAAVILQSYLDAASHRDGRVAERS